MLELLVLAARSCSQLERHLVAAVVLCTLDLLVLLAVLVAQLVCSLEVETLALEEMQLSLLAPHRLPAQEALLP
jgi:hypothetical protein